MSSLDDQSKQCISIWTLESVLGWDELARSGDGGTVFHERWFLRTAGVDCVLCVHDGGALVCGLPLFTTRDPRVASQSTRSVPYGGPVFARSRRGTRGAMLERRTVMSSIASVLQAGFGRVSFACAPGLHDLVPWLRAGFVPEVRYTYVLDIPGGCEPAAAMSPLRRRDLARAARAELQVIADHELRRFDPSKAVQWSTEPDATERTRAAIEAAIAARRGCPLVALAGDRVVGGLFMIWDDRTVYTTHSYYEPSAARSGVSTRLYLEAMMRAARMPGISQLDLEGSVLDGVERYYQSFGGRQSIYFALHWASDPRDVVPAALYRYG